MYSRPGNRPDQANMVQQLKNEVLLMATPWDVRSKNYYDSLSEDDDEEDIVDDDEKMTDDVSTPKRGGDPEGKIASMTITKKMIPC